jgi:hypothetical protein
MEPIFRPLHLQLQHSSGLRVFFKVEVNLHVFTSGVVTHVMLVHRIGSMPQNRARLTYVDQL